MSQVKIRGYAFQAERIAGVKDMETDPWPSGG